MKDIIGEPCDGVDVSYESVDTGASQQQRGQQSLASAVVSSSRSEEDQQSTSYITDQYVQRLSFSMMLLSLILIAIMLVLASILPRSDDSAAPAGWVAVAGAAVVFGSTGVPMKSPSLKELQVDSFVFAVYNSIGIFIVR